MSTAEQTCPTGAVPAVRLPRSRRLRPAAAFTGTALAFVAVALAVGAPSPLFVLYQQEWGFPSWLLTLAFAIYAVTLLITLLVAGSLFGFIGLLVAVPVAAAIGVLVRFGLRQYLSSSLYTGNVEPPVRRSLHK